CEYATVPRQQVVETMAYRALEDIRLVVDQRAAVLAGRHAVARCAGPQGVDRCRVRHHGYVFAAIGFGYDDLQVATISGGVQIVDFELARRHRGFVYDVAILQHAYAGIAVGNAAYRGGIAALRFRVHAFVAGQGHARETYAFEHGAFGMEFAGGELALYGSNRTLRIGLYALIPGTLGFAVVQVAAMAQSPGAKIEAAVQPHIGLCGVVAVAGGVPVQVRVVAQHACGGTFIPVFWVDLAACAAV